LRRSSSAKVYPSEETIVFVSYLIDPLSRTVTKVRDGFDRAQQLLGTDRLDIATLWTGSFDPDSSVDLVYADAAALDEPLSETGFRLRFECHGEPKVWEVTGKAVLAAGGDVPQDIASQIGTVVSVEAAIEFHSVGEAGVVRWNEHRGFTGGRISVRRSERSDHADRRARTRNDQ